ncbi:ATPase, T2SS/T4P/T4SS family [Mesorhizobium sp. CAU 1732]|uniref:ATPase, T2SS/T4P/T4SS family n=1 Tax=Mesorhizobium sp. CAU 1732 TaxID=3140358 RepID=UPI003260288C
MTSGAAEIIIGSVAHALGSEVDDDRPIVSGELPIDGYRFEGLLPPVVAAPAVKIRRRASRLIPLADYVRDGIMTAEQARTIQNAVSSRFNIVVSGGTGPVRSHLPMRSCRKSHTRRQTRGW